MADGNISPKPKKKPDLTELLVGIACGMAITLTALFLGVMPMVRHLAGARDYVVYWSTGQQLVHHANPYDPVAMGDLERSAGFDGKRGSYYMRNPPWGLPLALPLGFLGPRVAALPWSLLMLGILVICVQTLWKMFGAPGTLLEWLGICFPPALQCVIMGQTSLFLLLGLVLFLRNYRTRPFWAGAALWLCTLKPHLFLPFGLVLLIWIFVSRQWRVLAGALTAIAVSCVVTEIIDPLAWVQYAHWAHTSGIANEYIPCLSVELRDLINPSAKWLVLPLSVLGGIWAVIYYWPRRHAWDWLEHGNAVMLVSILVAPYCWIYDQSLAMPALMYGAWRASSRKVVAALALLYIWLELQPFYTPGLHSHWYLWPAPAWLAWYLYARWEEKRATVPAAPAIAEAVSLG
ncbi:MAG: glycosyltransferase family 87 protein [Acidobacteriaceae bacterium]